MPLGLKQDSLAVMILSAEVKIELSIMESDSREVTLDGDGGMSDPVPHTLSKARQ